MFTDRGMNKNVVHTDNGILFSNKKGLNNVICSNVDGPRNCHTEWSKSDREIQVSYDLHVESKNKWYKWTYLIPNRNRVIGVEHKLILGERINWDIGTDIYTLPYIKQIINKDLLL